MALTHASGFHLVTVAMTGHAEEMGSTTVAHSNLKCVVLNAVKKEQKREHGLVSIRSNGWLLALQVRRLLLPLFGYSRYSSRAEPAAESTDIQSTPNNVQQYDACMRHGKMSVLG